MVSFRAMVKFRVYIHKLLLSELGFIPVVVLSCLVLSCILLSCLDLTCLV
jgi:hypothetical protein